MPLVHLVFAMLSALMLIGESINSNALGERGHYCPDMFRRDATGSENGELRGVSSRSALRPWLSWLVGLLTLSLSIAGVTAAKANSGSSPSVVATIAVGDKPEQVAVNPAGILVYVTNFGSDSVSVFDTASNTVTATITGFSGPAGVVVNPAGTYAYVTNFDGNSVSVFNTATNTVTATIVVGANPEWVAVNPAGTLVYVSNNSGNSVSVIDTTTNTVTATIAVGANPEGVAVNPAGTRVYVSNFGGDSVSVIDTTNNTVIGSPIAVGAQPWGLAVNPAGTRVYVVNYGGDSVSVIDLFASIPSGPEVPRAEMQQFAVPAGTEASACADLAPESVDWPALVSMRSLGWTMSYAQWPNEGRGGSVCTRQPYWTGSGWSVI